MYRNGRGPAFIVKLLRGYDHLRPKHIPFLAGKNDHLAPGSLESAQTLPEEYIIAQSFSRVKRCDIFVVSNSSLVLLFSEIEINAHSQSNGS